MLMTECLSLGMGKFLIPIYPAVAGRDTPITLLVYQRKEDGDKHS
jgi:hypothetical protein